MAGFLNKIFHKGEVAIQDKQGRTFWVKEGTEDQYIATWHGCLKKNGHYMYKDRSMREAVEVTGLEYHRMLEESLERNRKDMERTLAELRRKKTPEEEWETQVKFWMYFHDYSREDAERKADEIVYHKRS